MTPCTVRSPVAVAVTTSPSAAPSPSSTGRVNPKVAVGNSPVSSASWTASSRRDSFVVIDVMSASKDAAASAVPVISAVPVASPVRPTASVPPTDASSSAMRKPTKVPVADSWSKSPDSAANRAGALETGAACAGVGALGGGRGRRGALDGLDGLLEGDLVG